MNAKAFTPFSSNPSSAFSAVERHADPRTATICLDTNVLLAPYRSSAETLDAIRKAFTSLQAAQRLIVPAQVAREFARNRLSTISELHKQLRDARSAVITGKFDAPLILHSVAAFGDATRELGKAGVALKRYRAALDKLIATVEGWQTSDPVLEVYEKIFRPYVVRELSIKADDLEEIRKARYDAQIPPGYRDRGKADGGVGDLAIWLTILEVGKTNGQDVILVSEDRKDDWFHRSGDLAVFPRYELIEEFAEATAGRSFDILSLSALLGAYGAAESVVREVKEREEVRVSLAGEEPAGSALMHFSIEQRQLTDAEGRPVLHNNITYYAAEAPTVLDAVRTFADTQAATIIGNVLRFPGFQAVATLRTANGVFTIQLTPTGR